MKPSTIPAVVLAAACGGAWGADFAAAGAKAKLSVSYRFESVGSIKGSKDRVFHLREWRVMRSVELVADLVAGRPQALPSMHPFEAAQTAKLQQQQGQMEKMGRQMAPMMAGAEAIVAKCGDDEKCIEREAMKMGAAMSGTKQLDDTLRMGKETAAVTRPGADRYQRWQGDTQKASYAIAESWHVIHADPICMKLPQARCTHDMRRQGGAEMAATPSAAALEVDLKAGTMVVQLPVPLGALAYEETHSTDEPQGTHDTPVPRGPVKGQLPMRVTADNGSVAAQLTVALKGGWRSQSGEYAVSLGAGQWHGVPGEPGKLIVRWRFVVL